MNRSCYGDLDLPHEDEYRGYEISVDRDPDPYRENLRWEIANDDGIWEVGTGYRLEDCLKEGKEAIDLRISGLAIE